jgi:hypothetical protein
MLLRFLALPFYLKGLLLCSWALAFAVRVGLYILPYRWLSKLPTEQVVWAIKTSSRFVPKATCLTQSITAATILNYKGHHTNVILGVVNNSLDSFEAHAWVESDGKIIIGKVKDMARYGILKPPKKAIL